MNKNLFRKIIAFTSIILAFSLISGCSEATSTMQVSTTSSGNIPVTKTQNPPSPSQPPAIPPTTDSQSPTKTSTLEPSLEFFENERSVIQNALEDVNLEFWPPVIDGNSETVTGRYIRNEVGNEIAVIAILYGSSSQLKQAIIQVLIPPGTDNTKREEIFSFMAVMSSTVVPNWKDNNSWLQTTLGEIPQRRQSQVIYEGFAATMERMVIEVPTMNATSYILSLEEVTSEKLVSIIGTPRPTPTSETGWTIYSDSDISFAYPVDWEIQDVSSEPQCQRVACLLEIVDPSQNSSLFILRMILDSSPSTSRGLDETLWSARLEILRELGLEEELILESVYDLAVDDRLAIERVFTEPNVLAPSSDQSVFVTEIVFMHGPYAYTLSLTSDTKKARDNNMFIVDQILKSIRLTPLILE